MRSSNSAPTLDASLLGDRFLDAQQAVPTSLFSRLGKTARTAVGLGRTVFSQKANADLEAVVRLTAQLGELKGVAMKMGQVLGFIDPMLPSEVRQILSLLQTRAPASSFESVEATVRAAFAGEAEKAEALLS